MATAIVSSPLKTHHGLFSSKTAGGRMPLTPSPHSKNLQKEAPTDKSPALSPSKQDEAHKSRASSSVYKNGNLSQRFRAMSSRSTSRHHSRDSSKSEDAKSKDKDSSARNLELGVSDYTLTGTTSSGTGSTESKPKAKKETKKESKKESKKDVNLRTKTAKTTQRFPTQKPDRFIPDRTTSEGLNTIGIAQPDETTRQVEGPLSIGNTAGAHDIGGGRTPDDELTNALEGLGLDDNESTSSSSSRPAPDAAAYESNLANACDIPLGTRILSFKPPAPESSKPIDLRAQYNRPVKSKSSSAQFRRRIQTAPERVLDAPGLVDDYYLNLLDWSSGNQVVVGLERSVYIWSADSGSVDCLMECSPDTYISSVKWSGDGAYVSVGLGTGEVQIWDVEEGTKLRSMFGHETRVGVMGWSKHTLSTGARSGLVFNHDVRIAQHKIAELACHTSEVCGLEWRGDGAQLATGGNDNLVAIWDARSLSAPKFTKANHRAAVKALSW
ncbi:ubiquitin-protein transferase activating protein, partial [Ascosphaera atra]